MGIFGYRHYLEAGLNMNQEQKLAQLKPEFRYKVRSILTELALWCQIHLPGRTPVLIETFRPQSRQDSLWAQGRTTPGKIVTWVRRGKHQTHSAADVGFSPLGNDGLWDAPPEAWAFYGHLVRKYDLIYGGDWHTPDRPHCEMK